MAVLGNENKMLEECKADNKKLKEWLYDSLMDEIGKICEGWDLTLRDNNEKNKVDIALKINDKIKIFIEKSSSSGKRITKWDSWPKLMREHKQFNCVGASLLGHYLLNQAKVENFVANPVGHVVNIIKLSEKEYLYADFLNCVIKKIKPKERKVGNLSILEIKDDFIEYQSILILKDDEIPSSIIGNLRSLIKSAFDSEEPDDSLGKKEATEFYEQFKHELTALDLDKIESVLYGDIDEFCLSDEVQKEKNRICERHESYAEFDAIIKKELSEDRIMQVKMFLKNNIHYVKKLILSDNESDLDKLSGDTRVYIKAYREWLTQLRLKNTAMYQKMIAEINAIDSILENKG